jgi:hypothetical protein
VHELLFLAIEIVALILLFYGFAKKGRWLMLLAGLLLLMNGPIHHRVRGFVVGGVSGAMHR